MSSGYDTAMAYLNQDKLGHIDMIESLRRKIGRVVAASEQGVLIEVRDAELYLISVRDQAAGEALIERMGTPALVTSHQEFVTAALAAQGMRPGPVCYQSAWLHASPPEVPKTDLEFRVLTPEFIPTATDLYLGPDGSDYVAERVNDQALIGAFRGTELTGFIGRHAEGSMGLLEVKPEFRQRGIASQLVAHLIGLELAAGRVPYAQFFVDNEVSRHLQERLGFTISTSRLAWLHGPAD